MTDRHHQRVIVRVRKVVVEVGNPTSGARRYQRDARADLSLGHGRGGRVPPPAGVPRAGGVPVRRKGRKELLAPLGDTAPDA
ncbi:hypothetical protein [Actinoplanes sp. NPDC049316]|uniref:hypothetical protein n=1 Tax=Actinoplanes sp. NPDC049316 TaxID=3154727 RepID=UPI00343784D3